MTIVLRIVPLIALLSIVLTGCGRNDARSVMASSMPADGVKKDANPDGLDVTPDQMKTMKTAVASVETIPNTEEATGKVGFNEDAITPLYSPYAGRIMELLAKPGDAIAKGAPLLVIDSPEVVDAENDFLAGRAALAKAEAVLKQAERTRDRVQMLVAGEAAAPKDLEMALTDLESARSDLLTAETQIESARQRLLNFGRSEAEIAQLADTRHADRTTRVMAPISGQIVARKVGPGQYTRPDNPDPLFTIANISTMWLLAEVYESQIPLVRVGERVDVKVLAFPDQKFPAQVDYISPTIDPATRRAAVRCVVQNRNNQLRPEMFASFRFEKAPRQAVVVPQEAVVREGNMAIAWVLENGDRIARRPVELGEQIDGKVEIKSGLNSGETVIADGALFLSSFVKN
jgi:cobalt-zinc-cadmium efflux system membrane fusion protein